MIIICFFVWANVDSSNAFSTIDAVGRPVVMELAVGVKVMTEMLLKELMEDADAGSNKLGAHRWLFWKDVLALSGHVMNEQRNDE